MILESIILAIMITLLIVHDPKLDYDKENNQLLLWYNDFHHRRRFFILFKK